MVWYLVLISLSVISFVSSFVQYICYSNKADRFVSLLIVTMIQLSLVIYVVSFFNENFFNLFLFLCLIVIIITNALHSSFVHRDFGVSMSKWVGFVLFFIIQIGLIILFYFIV